MVKALDQGTLLIVSFRSTGDLNSAIAVQATEGIAQLISGEAGMQQPCYVVGRKGQHLVLPVVVCHLLAQTLAVTLKTYLHRCAVLESLPAKTAPAEAMDGGDVGTFKPLQCFQQVAGKRATGVWILPMECQPLLHHCVARWGVALCV